jgi:DnaJ domain
LTVKRRTEFRKREIASSKSIHSNCTNNIIIIIIEYNITTKFLSRQTIFITATSTIPRNVCMSWSQHLLLNLPKRRLSYYTNGKRSKLYDPYHILGLQWGDGASLADIKRAFQEKARLLHPDVNREDSPAVAQRKFQELQKAYDSLMKKKQICSSSSSSNSSITNELHDDVEEWRAAIWRQGDCIAMDRLDVAGIKQQQPIPPVGIFHHISRELGHPDGRGATSSSSSFFTRRIYRTQK